MGGCSARLAFRCKAVTTVVWTTVVTSLGSSRSCYAEVASPIWTQSQTALQVVVARAEVEKEKADDGKQCCLRLSCWWSRAARGSQFTSWPQHVAYPQHAA